MMSADTGAAPATMTSVVDLMSALDRVRRDRLLECPDRAAALHALVEAGLDRLPAPGHGTLARWQVLAAVAAADLSLVKLFEGHTDALTILAEVDATFVVPPRSRWGTWAAESPGARVVVDDVPGERDSIRLTGTKAWCSGATAVTHALLTVWRPAGDGPYLAAVAMDQRGVMVTNEGWQAVGMAACASVDVRFQQASGVLVGGRGTYVSRPGFSQGGAGIATCWHGGAVAIGGMLRESLAGGRPDPHKLAALGAVDVALARNAALLREAAAAIDARPAADATALALRVRAAAEATANEVLDHAGRALGAAPFCRDARFARLAADLPVYIRQSHAERDLAALGASMLSDSEERSWAL